MICRCATATGAEHLRPEALDTVVFAQIESHVGDVRAGLPQLHTSGRDLVVLGADDQVIAVSGEFTGQFVTDSGRCSGDQGQGAVIVTHR